jgi:hypothetical protein
VAGGLAALSTTAELDAEIARVELGALAATPRNLSGAGIGPLSGDLQAEASKAGAADAVAYLRERHL